MRSVIYGLRSRCVPEQHDGTQRSFAGRVETNRKAHMSATSVMAMILEAELTARGVETLTSSDYSEIAEHLVRRITELDRVLAAGTAGESRAH